MDLLPADLVTRFHLLFPNLERETVSGWLQDVCEHYNEPHRHYHNLTHIRNVLEKIDELYPDPPVSLRLAGWLHDVIYDPRASDNEERSADYVHAVFQSSGVDLAEIARLILLTKTHTTVSDDRYGCVLLDADLAILCADSATYDDYARAIRREYVWVAEEDYRAGRIQVLTRFLHRNHIYFTQEMRGAAETSARDNIRREITALQAIADGTH